MRAICLALLVLAVGDQRAFSSEGPAREVSGWVTGARWAAARTEQGEVVSFLYLTPRCSASEVTWVRDGRERLRLERDYFPRRALYRWKLQALEADWSLEWTERSPGFEFDSVADTQPSAIAERTSKLGSAGRALSSEVTVLATGDEELAVATGEESTTAATVAAATSSGHLVRWRQAAPPTVTAELAALRALDCHDASRCEFAPLYDLAQALLGFPPPGVPTLPWTQIEHHNVRGLAAGAARIRREPLADSPCKGSVAEER